MCVARPGRVRDASGARPQTFLPGGRAAPSRVPGRGWDGRGGLGGPAREAELERGLLLPLAGGLLLLGAAAGAARGGLAAGRGPSNPFPCGRAYTLENRDMILRFEKLWFPICRFVN